jgi:LEA14-like dessication related protein
MPQLFVPRHAAACLILLSLSGCAAMQPGYEAPTVTVSSFRALPAQGGTPGFEIGLKVVNPNRAALDLEGVAYTVRLEGREVLKGVANDLPVIDGYGSGDILLEATPNLFESIRLIRDLIATPRESFDYELEAKLDPGGFRPPVRIRDTGNISLGPSSGY